MPIRPPRKGEKTSDYISKIIRQEMKENTPQKQAIAIAMSSARKYGRVVPKPKLRGKK